MFVPETCSFTSSFSSSSNSKKTFCYCFSLHWRLMLLKLHAWLTLLGSLLSSSSCCVASLEAVIPVASHCIYPWYTLTYISTHPLFLSYEEMNSWKEWKRLRNELLSILVARLAGWKHQSLSAEEYGIQGFSYPSRNDSLRSSFLSHHPQPLPDSSLPNFLIHMSYFTSKRNMWHMLLQLHSLFKSLLICGCHVCLYIIGTQVFRPKLRDISCGWNK